MKKFEYKLLTISVAHFIKDSFQQELSLKFDRWGEQGWDLVKMEPITSGGGFLYQGANTDKFLIVFKKEKLSD